MNTWTEEMLELFEDMRDSDEFRATLLYGSQTEISNVVDPNGDPYVNANGDSYVISTEGARIYGVKMPLSMGFTMNMTGYARKADTSFDMLRTEAHASGLYALCYQRDPAAKRPKVTINGEPFLVLDLKDDKTSDPTVKLILSSLQV